MAKIVERKCEKVNEHKYGPKASMQIAINSSDCITIRFDENDHTTDGVSSDTLILLDRGESGRLIDFIKRYCVVKSMPVNVRPIEVSCYDDLPW